MFLVIQKISRWTQSCALPSWALLSLALAASPAGAEPVREGRVTAELIGEHLAITPGQPLWVALRLQMDEGWHVNWRNAGDAGLPPVIHWKLPEGFTAGDIQWPYPERVVEPPLVSYGYHGEVLLLTRIETPPDLTLGSEVHIAADVEWLVCKGACIPGGTALTLTAPVSEDGAQPDPRWADDFAATRDRLPVAESGWQATASLLETELVLTLTPPDWWTGDLGEVYFLPYATTLIANAAEQPLDRLGDEYRLTIMRARNSGDHPERIAGVLYSSIGWRGSGSEKAIAFDAAVGDLPQSSSMAGSTSLSGSIWKSLLFAFLGGIILNLMPCVLPVLSLKVMGLIQGAGEARRTAVAHGGMYTLGVLFAFWVLAGVLLGLRSAGEQLGWGFQLQSPTFVVILASLLFLLGLSLFGVFEIGTSLMGLGSRAGSRAGSLGAFNSGILAVVVATPCTAPFMGSALGYALIQPPVVSLLIFTFLGLGLALPYAVLAAAPAMLRFVPRPGAWMETLKQFMGFLLMATVVWLAWVLGNQSGAQAVTVLLSMFVLLGLAAWIWGRWGTVSRGTPVRIVAAVVALILSATSIGWGILSVDMLATDTDTPDVHSAWEPYSPERARALRTAGTPVFIDFTADWCLSCQVNERVALDSDDVQQRFRDLGVVLMKADWTRRNETITRALAEYGRSSVPLYVLYDGKTQNPVFLPEILTPGIVLDALKDMES